MKEKFFGRDKWGEWLVFAGFLTLLIIVSCFHEITYDEAQAWLIARDASFRDLLLLIPHYEGHPPLWHLLLALFAKSGVAPHAGLHILTIAISSCAVWLILFQSPFPKMIKFVLPFTYYVFYRYSVVARPYCLTLLAFTLAAMFYKEKEQRPVRFCFALLLLCASNAFGMVLAAGICIAWLIELLTDKVKRDKMRWLRAGISLSVLLILNVLQLLLMIPRPDTNAVGNYPVRTFLNSLIYMLVIAPADAMFLDSGMDARLQDYAEGILFGSPYSVIFWILGILSVAVILIYMKKKKKLLLFLVPYLMFSVFAAKVYFWYHHIGLTFLFLLFVVWCAEDACAEAFLPSDSQNAKFKFSERSRKMLVTIMFVLGLGVSAAWNAYDCFTDVTSSVWYTKDVADGIRLVGADQDNCALQWNYYRLREFENLDEMSDPHNYGYNVSITCFFDCLVYFDNNIFYNHNDGIKEISYNRQILYSGEREEQLWEEISAHGYPEFIVGNSIVLGAVAFEEPMPIYVPVYRFEVRKPDKFMVDYNDQFIYAREDIYRTRSEWPVREQMRLSGN